VPERARYLGAAGAVGVLSALLGGPGPVSVGCAGSVRLDLTVHGTAAAGLPARFLAADQFEPGRAPLVRRQVPVLVDAAAVPEGEPAAFVPPDAVVLTDLPDLDKRLDLPAGTTVVCTADGTERRPGWLRMPVADPDAVRQALAARPVRHVRVVTDLSPHGVGGSERLFALHDALFLAVKHAGTPLSEAGSSVVVLLLGAADDAVPHPVTGLFTGLVKAVDLELPACRTFTLCTTERDPAAGARLAARESGVTRTFPVVYYVDGVRRVPVLADEPVEVASDQAARLGADSVVVAVGGARGITAEVTKALAEHFRPRIYVFGSNRLDDYPDEVFGGDDAAFAASRPEFIRRRLRDGSNRTVAQLNREFDRMGNARDAAGTLARLRELCGADRVRYLVCDVADEEAVTTAVQKVLADAGRVDLLVNAAGRNHSALIRDKDFAEFQRIRDIKVRGYANLKRAFGEEAPAHWCNFGSLLGYFGQLGEADYASGNDFLASAAGHAVGSGQSEFTIGWTFWDGVGMVGEKGSLANAHFKREASYSDMTVAEGVHHFVRELHAENRRPSVVHVGAAERRTVEALYPGYLTRARFYVGRAEPVRDAGAAMVEFDLERDAYLRNHLVRGVPTLPGAFVAELAGEAALELVPGATVVSYTDVRFHHFLYVHRDLPTPPKRVRATVTGRDGDRTTVHVTISADVRSPGGVLLVRDRPHFTTNVVLAGGYPAAPSYRPWPDPARDVPAEESFRAPDAPIMLSGPFLCVDDLRRAPGRARSTYRLRLGADDPLATSFFAPSFLFDGMVRTAFLTEADGRAAPVGAPTLIGEVAVFEPGNDVELMARYGELGMYATSARTPDGRLEHQLVAVAPDGHVVATMTDVRTTIIDW
jgi:NAD(P)-dependent dehydrogenase (short-subunit alcohol dehydrogenase family)